jgi:hypothetical protein
LSPQTPAAIATLVQLGPLDRFVNWNRPHLDLVLRELVSHLQARAQRIDEASMPRFRPSIDLKEIVLVLQTARTAFHGTLQKLSLRVCRNLAVSGSKGPLQRSGGNALGFEYAFDWLPFPGLFLKTEYRYSQYGGNNGTSVPLTGSVVGIPVTGAALNSQKATQFISTELVWRFNWFGGHY